MNQLMKGNLTISRVTGSKDGDYVSIAVGDEISGCRVLDVQMSVEQFALTLLGRGYADCLFVFRKDAPVGKKRETKVELIDRPTSVYKVVERAAVEDELFRPLEVDGWKARRDDIWNHHNWQDNNKVSVHFYRFVD